MKNKIAIVVSKYNHVITDELLDGALIRLLETGLTKNNLAIISVPGAVEIPLTAQLLAKTKEYQAIICLGCVIQGDTDHYDYVCEQVSQGCQRVMLEHEIPVIFGVLTTKNLQQAKDRIGGKDGHKGIEAADAALEMISIVSELRGEKSIKVA